MSYNILVFAGKLSFSILAYGSIVSTIISGIALKNLQSEWSTKVNFDGNSCHQLDPAFDPAFSVNHFLAKNPSCTNKSYSGTGNLDFDCLNVANPACNQDPTFRLTAILSIICLSMIAIYGVYRIKERYYPSPTIFAHNPPEYSETLLDSPSTQTASPVAG